MAGETGAGALRRTGGIFTKQHRTRHGSGSFPSDAASLPPAHPFCKRKLQPRKNIVPSDKISPKGGGKIVEFILTCHTSGGMGQLPGRGPGAILLLAVAASWSLRIFFLGRPRKKMLCKRKKTPKETLRKGFLWTLSQTEGAAAPQTPWGFLWARIMHRTKAPLCKGSCQRS